MVTQGGSRVYFFGNFSLAFTGRILSFRVMSFNELSSEMSVAVFPLGEDMFVAGEKMMKRKRKNQTSRAVK